jgi:hypothetical protein
LITNNNNDQVLKEYVSIHGCEWLKHVTNARGDGSAQHQHHLHPTSGSIIGIQPLHNLIQCQSLLRDWE